MINSWARWPLAIAFLVATPVRSQSSAPVLPVPLATALIGGGDRMASQGSPEYFVGALPTGFPAMLVPSGAVTVVGGMRTGGQIVVVLADSTRRLPAVLEELFESLGYMRPPATPASGFSSALGPYQFFCKDSVRVTVEPLMGAVRDMARVTYPLHDRAPCNAFAPPPPREGRLRVPPLTPMPGAEVSSSGGQEGDDGIESRAVARGTTVSPAALLAHYTAQLVAAGWKAGAPAVGARVAAQFFEATDDTGIAWQGTMMVSGTKTSLKLALSMQPR